MPTAWDTVQFSFSAGLNQKGDKRVQNPPYLDIATDCQFDEVGGLQTRNPFDWPAVASVSTGLNILGGGTITNPRRFARNGDELLLFTDVSLYSWSIHDSAWVLKGPHLAVAGDEATRFAFGSDQMNFDRAELGNVAVVCWMNFGETVWVGAYDLTSKNIVLAPTLVDANGGRIPKVVALASKIVLLWERSTTSDLLGLAIDPANVATSVAAGIAAPTTIHAGATFTDVYDAVKIPGQDSLVVVSVALGVTSYIVTKVTAAMAKTASTKARTCDGAIAVSVDPAAAVIQVIRGNGVNVQGDKLTLSTLADATINQAVGTIAAGTVDAIAAAHRSTQDSGQYRCYAFWTTATGVGTWLSKSNWVDTGGTLGTQANFVRLMGIASRAFTCNGSVYFWGAFASPTPLSAVGFRYANQNAYFLYRDDGLLVSKAVDGAAAGYPNIPVGPAAVLPGVQLTSGSTTFVWCGGIRSIIPTGTLFSTGYAARVPREVTFTFDSDTARRTVSLGPTMYISGGLMLQYDGSALFEVGFPQAPWDFSAASSATAGSVVNGDYAVKGTWKHVNAAGDIDRSTSATAIKVTEVNGPTGSIDVNGSPPAITRRTSSSNKITWEVWRTAISPTPDFPFYLATNIDPSVTSNPNRYISVDTTAAALTALNDGYADGTLTAKQNNPENDSSLESYPPPSAAVIAASVSRIFLGAVAGDPDRIWYSKLRNSGEVAAFNGQLVFDVPKAGGDITAIAFLNETMIVFRETAIYAVPGDGFSNTGGGQNYGPARTISTDIGAINQESVTLTEVGLLFKSDKGWHVVASNLETKNVGEPVTDFDLETPVAVVTVQSQHQVRIFSAERMLVWDTYVNQWGEWTIAGSLDSCMWLGSHVYLDSSGPHIESNSPFDYGMEIATSWIKMNDLQGAGAVRWIEVLGELVGTCVLHIQCAYDYQVDINGDWLYLDDAYWTPSPNLINGPLQVRHAPRWQKCEAIKVRIRAIGSVTASLQTLTAKYAVTGLQFVSQINGELALYLRAVGDLTNGDVIVRDLGNVAEIHFTPGTTTSDDVNTAFESVVSMEVTANDTPSYVWQSSDAFEYTPFSGVVDVAVTGSAAVKLTGLSLEVGRKQGLYKRLAAAQKA